METVDMDRSRSLGVVLEKEIPEKQKIEKLYLDLTNAFSTDKVSKEDIVELLEAYLPEFKHIEAGKSLDSKM